MHIINKLKRIIKIIRFEWSRGDWDNQFIIETLKFKLECTRDHFLKHNYLAESELNKMIPKINICIQHLDAYLDPEDKIWNKYYQSFIQSSGFDIVNTPPCWNKSYSMYDFSVHWRNEHPEIYKNYITEVHEKEYKEKQMHLQNALILFLNEHENWWD